MTTEGTAVNQAQKISQGRDRFRTDFTGKIEGLREKINADGIMEEEY
jgi:hypothetical protein